jgi:hypothetical protein
MPHMGSPPHYGKCVAPIRLNCDWMPIRYLARLRLARVRCNENIARLETSLGFQRSRREAIEPAIPTGSRR